MMGGMSTQSTSRYLMETPPWCPTVECYMHGNGQEHHVEGCPLYDTLASASHRFGEACAMAARQIATAFDPFRREMRKTWRGRLQMLVWDIRFHWLRR